MINYSSIHLLEVTSCAVFVDDHDVFKEIEVGRLRELTGSSIIVDCKNVFKGKNNIVYLGIGKGGLR